MRGRDHPEGAAGSGLVVNLTPRNLCGRHAASVLAAFDDLHDPRCGSRMTSTRPLTQFRQELLGGALIVEIEIDQRVVRVVGRAKNAIGTDAASSRPTGSLSNVLPRVEV